MAGGRGEKKIKSADRVLAVFEMFSAARQSLTVMEVARTLKMPQSSTSELLGSLVRRGYLARDRSARAFRPTARIPLLGAWVHPTLFRDGRLLPMMDDLAATTGQAAALCSLVGVSLRHLHIVAGQTPVPDGIRAESDRHPFHSPFGLTLHAGAYNEHVRKLLHRLNAESPPDQHMRFAELSARLDLMRKQGFAAGRVGEGWSGVAVLLPQCVGEEQLSLGLIGRADEIENREQELVQGLRSAISRHLGPRLARNADREPSFAFAQPG